MAIQTGGVLGKVADVRERSIAFAHFLPILRGNHVTGTTCQLLCDNVSLMRELRVIDARLFWCRDFLLPSTLLWLVAGLCSCGERHKVRCQKQQKRRGRERNRTLIAELHWFEEIDFKTPRLLRAFSTFLLPTLDLPDF